MSMVEPKFHLLQVQEKMTPPDAIVPPQLGLGKAPEVLDAVDVPTATVRKRLFMENPVVAIAISEQPVIAAEPIGVNRAAPGDLWPDDSSQHGPAHIGHWTGIDAAAPLQEPEHDHFTLHSAAPQMLADAAEITLIDLDSPVSRASVSQACTIACRITVYTRSAVCRWTLTSRAARRAGTSQANNRIKARSRRVERWVPDSKGEAIAQHTEASKSRLAPTKYLT